MHSVSLRRIGLLAAACLFSTLLSAGTLVTGFGSNPGNLNMYKYVPGTLQSSAPLVVILHGCTQSGSAFESETGWTGLADEYGFAVVIAEQKSGNNSSSCFNWFETGDIARGSGEALSIKQMVDKMKNDYTIDNNRVFVVGFSAGGAMVTVMLATYPDVFAGGGVLAGVPYRCGTGLTNAFSCMSPGKNQSPTQWANNVFNASSHSGPWPKVSIWHGDADYTVSYANANEIMEQWTQVNGIDQTPDVEDTVKGYPHKVWKDGSGNEIVELFTITGMGHAYPIDPGSADDQGGSTGAYTTDEDIFSSYHMAKFFGLDDSDSTPPTVSITSPSTGATVSGTVSVTASASDDVAVSSVDFFIDGMLVGTDTSSPYSYSWSTSSEANGTHSIFARAVDSSGNTATSDTISVTVTGGVEDVTPPSVTLTFPTGGESVYGTVALTATASDDFGVTSVEFFVDSVSIGTGVPSGQAGPWEFLWNSTSVSDGSHTVSVKAYDAKGNEGSDGPVSITVDQDVLVLDETFSDRDGNSDSLDSDAGGWTANGWVADSDNHTLGPAGSGSAYASVSSGSGCSGGAKTEDLKITLDLGDDPILTYQRKMSLSARVNLSTSAYFRVYCDGNIVDEQSVTYATYSESSWTERTVDLSAYANQTVELEFEVMANSNVCLAVTAEAWVDDLSIGTPDGASDTTPPTTNITSPANNATVDGTIDITASASDNDAVAKVEFYVDGNLIGVDTSSPYSVSWDTTSVPDGDYQLLARACDDAGNVGSDNDTTVTVDNSGGGGGGGGGGGTPTSVTFNNSDSNDGYVKATSSGGSPAVGSGFMESYYGLALGRGTDGKFNRTVLSFDTSSLPDSAVISRAYITVTRNSSSGDPWASPSGNELVIDVKTGCIGGCTIATSDWAASMDASAVAKLVKWTSGSQTSTDFSAAGLNAINLTGTTQLKLRFTSNQTATNYIFIDNGSSATLTVEYQ
ncbi:MAG: PHB depolymerase family esterase [Acidobacteriota bacterium]|nr:PHB depolymerase family esterase [Acidobacteriota bacterium]